MVLYSLPEGAGGTQQFLVASRDPPSVGAMIETKKMDAQVLRFVWPVMLTFLASTWLGKKIGSTLRIPKA